MEYEIRKVEEKDREAINMLATKLLMIHKINLPHVFAKDKLEFSKEDFKKIIMNNDYYMIIAQNKENDEVIGFAYFEVYEQKEDLKLTNARIGEMSMIYIEKPYRREKIGLELMKMVEEYAKNKKSSGEIDRIELRIWGFNSVSEQFSKNRNLNVLYTMYEII